MYLECVWVPGVTNRRTCSAAKMVRAYDSGVRAIVDRKR